MLLFLHMVVSSAPLTALLVLLVLITLQTLFSVLVLFRFNAELKAVDRLATNFLHRLHQELAAARRLLSLLAPIIKKLPDFQSELSRILEVSSKMAQKANGSLEGWLRTCGTGLETFERQAGTLVNRFSQKTLAVHRAILHPAIEISAALRGALSALTHLFSRKKSPASVLHGQDQQIFI